jgi:murein DD-endopeptidase MepM/ murein hydrolase activator NlpD
VEEIVKAGRSRWKVENEGNNVLKNHGYNLEHNFGHGQNHLLLSLNLLAFLFNTVLDLVN